MKNKSGKCGKDFAQIFIITTKGKLMTPLATVESDKCAIDLGGRSE